MRILADMSSSPMKMYYDDDYTDDLKILEQIQGMFDTKKISNLSPINKEFELVLK